MYLKNLNQISKGSRVCLYGSGAGGDKFLSLIKEKRSDIQVVFFIDSYKSGRKGSYSIINVTELSLHRNLFDYIIITSVYWEEIIKSLKQHGFHDFLVADQNHLAMLVVCVFSYTCNLRCRHCWNFNNIHIVPKDHLDNELRVDQWQNIFDKSRLLSNSNTILAFEGGEIFYLKHYYELMSMISKLKLNSPINIITNGTFPDRVEHLVRTTDISKKAWFMISIDGMRDTHDLIRGKGTFDKALKTINILKNYGCKVSIGTCVQKQNISELKQIFDFFHDKCDGHGFGMESIGNGYIDFNKSEIEYLKNYLTPDMIELLENGENIRQNITCTAGINKVRIEPNGVAIACINSFHNQPIILGDLRNYNLNFDNLWYSTEADNARSKVIECKKCLSFCER